MFGPKKHKLSKKDLKKSIVNANDRLRAINARMELDIEVSKDKLKSIGADYDAYKKALEDTKELKVYAQNELEAQQFEIAEAQSTVKEALSRIVNLSEDEAFLEDSNEKLEVKRNRLSKDIALLEKKQVELENVTAYLKATNKECSDSQKKLESLAVDLNELENGVEAYISRKSAAESEFKAFKAKIERDKVQSLNELSNIKDQADDAKLASGKEMGRLDKAIAERISELQDMETRLHNETFKFTAIQSKVSVVEEMVKDAEERMEYAVNKEQEKVSKIKGDFRNWKVEALDDVARLKIKGKIENINKAGLKEVLDG